MKICLVGHLGNRPDEGVRKLAYCLANLLAKQHDIMTLNISCLTSWRKIRAFQPDIIHYILCPTGIGLVTAKIISLTYPKAKTVISAPQSAISAKAKWLSLFRPDIVLVQSYQSEKVFKLLGYRTQFLPNGVDIQKFTPVDVETKQKLRRKYGLPNDKFVILHMASFKKGRNLEVLKKLQLSNKHNQVLIVGRPSERGDEDVINELKEAGCLIWNDYFPNLEEVYGLSDCYIFPTVNKRNSIEMPLSVLEAMSCNLPVITTRFCALPRIFDEGGGFFFAEKEEDFFKWIEEIKKGNLEVKTREKVLPYSWNIVTKRLVGIYEKLIHN
jgi:glycosyltransferase involved in cell wall biosynthesis